MDEIEDQVHVASARAGERRAFEALVRKYTRLAGAIAFGVLGDYQRAEDVAQEAFLKAFQSLRQLRDGKRFKAWFSGIVRSIAIDHRRARASRLRAEQAEPVIARAGRSSPSAEETRIHEESLEEVRGCIAELPEADRTVVVLKHLEGLSYQEIAELLDASVSAVESRLFRARRALRERLGARSPGGESGGASPDDGRSRR